MIFTRDYIAQARTLAESVRDFHPDVRICGLVADNMDVVSEQNEKNMELLPLSVLGDQELVRKMVFYYTPLELCCALRPFFHQYIQRHTEVEQWIYLDTDMLLLDSLEDAFRALEASDICLTPHAVRPAPEGRQPGGGIYYETGHLPNGVFNGGFLGIRRSTESGRFIEWFKQRLTYYCFQNPGCGLYLDQLWLNYVPAFFKGVHILSDERMNVAYWNLNERPLELRGGKIHAGGKPVIFFHFSGWRADRPEKLSSCAPWCDLSANDAWQTLSGMYQEKLKGNGLEETSLVRCRFSFFSDGRPVLPEMRKKYYVMLRENAWTGGDPFDNSGFFYDRFCRRPVRVRKFFEILSAGVRDAFAVFRRGR